ncbi:hypothetical protein Tco_0894862 [Tanacetum coccineum]|uniref:Uncharacterized protein n=1 Tax=Tanacetum coccineum TaxID=301880 RepID=A0ABQ5CCX6_9ASTR
MYQSMEEGWRCQELRRHAEALEVPDHKMESVRGCGRRLLVMVETYRGALVHLCDRQGSDMRCFIVVEWRPGYDNVEIDNIKWSLEELRGVTDDWNHCDHLTEPLSVLDFIRARQDFQQSFAVLQASLDLQLGSSSFPDTLGNLDHGSQTLHSICLRFV